MTCYEDALIMMIHYLDTLATSYLGTQVVMTWCSGMLVIMIWY